MQFVVVSRLFRVLLVSKKQKILCKDTIFLGFSQLRQGKSFKCPKHTLIF